MAGDVERETTLFIREILYCPIGYGEKGNHMSIYIVYTRNKEDKGKWKYLDAYSAETGNKAINTCVLDTMQTCMEMGMHYKEFIAHVQQLEFKAKKIKEEK